jgi:acetyl/propionyl-CoA carboxylase alpha subunit
MLAKACEYFSTGTVEFLMDKRFLLFGNEYKALS